MGIKNEFKLTLYTKSRVICCCLPKHIASRRALDMALCEGGSHAARSSEETAPLQQGNSRSHLPSMDSGRLRPNPKAMFG